MRWQSWAKLATLPMATTIATWRPAPQAQAQAASTLVNTLMGQKIQMEADLRNLLTYLREDAPQVVSARNAIQSLQAQIDEEKSKITAQTGAVKFA